MEAVKILFGKYQTGRILGRGTFAKVYYAEVIGTGEAVAVKVIKKEQVRSPAMMEQIKREISIMRLVRHPHIVELKEVMATKTKIFLVMEYVKGGELFAKIAKGKLREDTTRKYFQQLISAVDFCHSNGVIHRDLKPENLLLDEEENLKVSDFGLSVFQEPLLLEEGLLQTRCGTPAYIAPEVLRDKGYDGTKADIWSCGVVLYVLLAGFLPFQDETINRMYRKILRGEYKCPPWFSSQSKHLITKILVPNLEKRITMNDILRNSWFRKGFVMPSAVSLDDHQVVTSNSRRGGGGMMKSPSSPALLNAFEFISTMSSGADLSSLFENKKKTESVFTSRCSATVIMAKIQLMAKRLNFKVARVSNSKLRLQGPSEGRKGRLLVTTEVFKVASEVAVVKFSKVSGDNYEYTRFVAEEVRPSLKDIVWTWHGDTIVTVTCNDNNDQQRAAKTPPEIHREPSFNDLVDVHVASSSI